MDIVTKILIFIPFVAIFAWPAALSVVEDIRDEKARKLARKLESQGWTPWL